MSLVVLPGSGPVPVDAQGTECEFILGFATLRDLAGADIVGECLENQAFAGNGDAQQPTTGGLLAWRKVDNWTAFTNGYQTWLNGPDGLVIRLNTERFEWEHDLLAGPATLPGESGELSAGPPLGAAPGIPEGAMPATVAAVERVDTLAVTVNGAVLPLRLIGVAVSLQCPVPDAAGQLQVLAGGQGVYLEVDPLLGDVDATGQAPRYVWLADGRLLNQELLAQGLAVEPNFGESYSRQEQFREAQQAARAQRLGLWGVPPCGPLSTVTPSPTRPVGAATATPGAGVSTVVPASTSLPSGGSSTGTDPAVVPTLTVAPTATPTATPIVPATATATTLPSPTPTTVPVATPVATPVTTLVFQFVAGSVLVDGTAPPVGTLLEVLCRDNVVSGVAYTQAHDSPTNRDFQMTVYGRDANTAGSTGNCQAGDTMVFRVNGAIGQAGARAGVTGNNGTTFAGSLGSISVVDVAVTPQPGFAGGLGVPESPAHPSESDVTPDAQAAGYKRCFRRLLVNSPWHERYPCSLGFSPRLPTALGSTVAV